MTRKSEAGQALVLTAVALVALLGVMGLAIDMGVLRYDKRLQQTAADAAALAGAADIINSSGGAGSQGVVTGAMNASATNGFADTTGTSGGCAIPPSNLAVGQVAVTVCNPPEYGPHSVGTNINDYVEVYVSVGQPTYFMKVLGVDSETVTARAVATAQKGYAFNGGCMYTIGAPQDSVEGISVGGNPTLFAPNCGISDNGNFHTNGNALNVTASTLGVAGGTSASGPALTNGDVSCTSPGVACPASIGGFTDPMAGQLPPAPTPGSPVYTLKISGDSNSTGGCNPATNCSYANGVYTIFPGTYCSITITGTSSAANIVFDPGTYIIEGTNGGCSTESLNIPGNGTISGNGVFFYFTGSSTVNITGTPLMELTAPSAGTYAGILMWQDATDTNTGPFPNGPTLGGNSGSYFNGIMYFPSDQLTFYGNTTSGQGPTCGTSGVGYDVGVVISAGAGFQGDACVNLLGASALPSGTANGVLPALVE